MKLSDLKKRVDELIDDYGDGEISICVEHNGVQYTLDYGDIAASCSCRNGVWTDNYKYIILNKDFD